MNQCSGKKPSTAPLKSSMVLACVWLCLSSSSCVTKELWADDTSFWPLARDVPLRIQAAYVDDASRLHILIQTEAVRFAYAVPMPCRSFQVTWVGRDEIETVNDSAAASWARPTTVPLAIVPDDKQAVDCAFASGSRLVLALDPNRHTIINGTLRTYFIASAGPEPHFLPLLSVRWLSLNAARHFAATPPCVAADILLLPLYLVYYGLAATGLMKTYP